MTTHATDRPLLAMITQLRQHEEVMLFSTLVEPAPQDGADTTAFLEREYTLETLHWPHSPPPFEAAAALWAAQAMYTGAQLLLAREGMPAGLPALLPDYTGAQSAGAILSADLCLRFLPAMIKHLRAVDDDDPLLPLLEKKLAAWHYSGVDYALDLATLDFAPYTDPCVYALYRDRIIRHQHIALARHPAFEPAVRAALGLHGHTLWKKFDDTIHPAAS